MARQGKARQGNAFQSEGFLEMGMVEGSVNTGWWRVWRNNGGVCIPRAFSHLVYTIDTWATGCLEFGVYM